MKLRLKLNLPTRKRSKASETRAAATIGGRLQPGSGSIKARGLKADVKSPVFLLEDKTTTSNSYRVEIDTWRKISGQAWATDRRPVLRLEFSKGPTLYVVDEMTFKDMINALK